MRSIRQVPAQVLHLMRGLPRRALVAFAGAALLLAGATAVSQGVDDHDERGAIEEFSRLNGAHSCGDDEHADEGDRRAVHVRHTSDPTEG